VLTRLLEQLPQCSDRQIRDGSGDVRRDDRRAESGDCQQARGGLRRRDGDANAAGGSRGAFELRGNGVAIADQAAKAADVQHHGGRAVPLDARREITRDGNGRLHGSRRPQAGVRRRDRSAASLGCTGTFRR